LFLYYEKVVKLVLENSLREGTLLIAEITQPNSPEGLLKSQPNTARLT